MNDELSMDYAYYGKKNQKTFLLKELTFKKEIFIMLIKCMAANKI